MTTGKSSTQGKGRIVSTILCTAVAALLILPGCGLDSARAANVCASCHADGRSGTPPATPTHVRMGLVAAPSTSTSTAAAPATSAPAAPAQPIRLGIAPATSAGTAPAASAGTSAGTTKTVTAAAGNGSVCAKCHSDGRSGVTPPGHPAISGMYGNGNPPPKAAKGTPGVRTARGGKAAKNQNAKSENGNKAGGQSGESSELED